MTAPADHPAGAAAGGAVGHTPGPWHRNIKPARKYNTIAAGRNTHVAHLVVNGLTDAEIEANCNLITAAPELLAALTPLATIARLIDEDGNLYRLADSTGLWARYSTIEGREFVLTLGDARAALAALAKATQP